MSVNSSLNNCISCSDDLSISIHPNDGRIFRGQDENTCFINNQFEKIKKGHSQSKKSIDFKVHAPNNQENEKPTENQSLIKTNKALIHFLKDSQIASSSNSSLRTSETENLLSLPVELLGIIFSKNSNLRDIYEVSLGPKIPSCPTSTKSRLKLSQGLKSALAIKK